MIHNAHVVAIHEFSLLSKKLLHTLHQENKSPTTHNRTVAYPKQPSPKMSKALSHGWVDLTTSGDMTSQKDPRKVEVDVEYTDLFFGPPVIQLAQLC